MAHFFGALAIFSIILIVNSFGLPSNLTNQVVVQLEEKITEIEITCINETDCNNHGVCINGTVCQCEPGWTESKNAAGVPLGPCSYKQSTKKSAFLFSLLLGFFGADWFYLSRKTTFYIFVGIGKLLFGIVSFLVTPTLKFGIEFPQNETMSFRVNTLLIFVNVVTTVWWIVDWARILANKFPDGNGIPLLPW